MKRGSPKHWVQLVISIDNFISVDIKLETRTIMFYPVGVVNQHIYIYVPLVQGDQAAHRHQVSPSFRDPRVVQVLPAYAWMYVNTATSHTLKLKLTGGP